MLGALGAGVLVGQTLPQVGVADAEGARVEHGVQALAALADVSAEAPDPAGLQPVELVRVYEQIASSTWAAVSRPVAGTLLTVARDAAAAARAALRGCDLDVPATIADLAAAAALALSMLLGRFAYVVPVIALAGRLAAKPKLAPSPGTFPTHGILFAGLLAGVILILGGLQFFPALALGPIAEQVQMTVGQTF